MTCPNIALVVSSESALPIYQWAAVSPLIERCTTRLRSVANNCADNSSQPFNHGEERQSTQVREKSRRTLISDKIQTGELRESSQLRLCLFFLTVAVKSPSSAQTMTVICLLRAPARVPSDLSRIIKNLLSQAAISFTTTQHMYLLQDQ